MPNAGRFNYLAISLNMPESQMVIEPFDGAKLEIQMQP